MKEKILKTSLLALTIGLFISSCDKEETEPSDSPVIIEEAFKKDASGWTIIGDAQGGYVAASYSPEGGVTDGYIFAKDDVTGGVWYFAAPKEYEGNQSRFYGTTLTYSLFQESNMSNQFLNEDIIFKSGSKQIYFQIDNFPNLTWTNYSIKIDENSGWRIGAIKGENKKATKEEIEAVLSNVTDFWIRGEYETGPDKGGLDNVKISK